MARAMPWPCCLPCNSVRRIRRSSVPCRCALYSRSDRFRIDIRPEHAYTWVECQPVDDQSREARMWSRQRRPDEDFAREVDAHVQLEADRLVEAGLSPE